MTISANAGPLIEFGQNPPVVPGTAPADYNQDYAPSAFSMGVGLLDPRYGYQIGGVGNGSASAFMFAPGVNYAVLDQVPSLAAVAVIAAGAHVVTGTPMALVSTTGGGVTVMTAPLNIKPTGNTVPACLALDGLPGFVAFGQSLALSAYDPTTMLARAVTITSVASSSGGAFTVRGFDVYGQPMTETLTSAGGVATVVGKKAFKFVQSVTPGFTDAFNYSVGTSDVYGLPLRAGVYGYVNATFNNAPVTAPTFVAADATPVTAITGDVRGTISVTSDGTKRLQVMQGIGPVSLSTLTPTVYTGLFGLTNYAG